MSKLSPRWIRLALVTTSTAGSLLVGGVVLRVLDRDRPRHTVEIVDKSAEITALLDERSELAADPEVPDVYPPPLRRVELTLEEARTMFPQLDRDAYEYHTDVYFWPKAGWSYKGQPLPEHPKGRWRITFNDHGMRMRRNVLTEKPDLRILITGDSHTAGVVPPGEAFAHVLENSMRAAHPERVETLNAGMGGFHLYNYLGLHEHFDDLEADVFVVLVYGGNDFGSPMELQRFFHNRPSPHYGEGVGDRLRAARERFIAPVAQELSQVVYFRENPEDVQVAIDTAASITLELQQRCEKRGQLLLLGYLPPPFVSQPDIYETSKAASMHAIGLTDEDLEVSNTIADGWLAYVRERGIPHVDLREAFAASEEPLYWFMDHHINTRGHEVVSEEMMKVLEPLIWGAGEQ